MLSRYCRMYLKKERVDYTPVLDSGGNVEYNPFGRRERFAENPRYELIPFYGEIKELDANALARYSGTEFAEAEFEIKYRSAELDIALADRITVDRIDYEVISPTKALTSKHKAHKLLVKRIEEVE